MTTLAPIRPLAIRSCAVIAVGVRSVETDRAVLDWALAAAGPHDIVHVVHAFVPRQAGDQRLVAQRVVRRATQYATGEHTSAVVGSAIAGLPHDVLVEMSSAVDLLVIGADHGPRAQVADWVQDRATCPVIVVPESYRAVRDSRPVTVVGDDRGFGASALDFAAATARRRHVTLQVARVWSAKRDGQLSPGWLAERQEEMDLTLADLSIRHPGLPVLARIELVPGWLALARGQSSLVVAERRLSGWVQARRSITAPCPVAIVPA